MPTSPFLRYAAAIAAALALNLPGSIAHADPLPEGLRYDDAFAWYQVDSRGEMRNGRPTHRYQLTASARIFGSGIARTSVFRFVLKQRRRTIGEFVCRGHLRTYDPAAEQPDSFLNGRCLDHDLFLDATGDITVEVHFIDDRDDSDYLAATHTITVRRLRRENHQGNEQPSDFFVDQHGFDAVGYLSQLPQGVPGPLDHDDRGAGSNRVFFTYQRSDGSRGGVDNVRCRVNGETIDMGSRPIESATAGSRAHTASQVLRRNGRAESEQVRWMWEALALPITFGEEGAGLLQNAVRLEDHPGQWRCELRDRQRRTLRQLAFEVVDGNIVAHPEDATLSLPPGTHLVDMVVPPDSPIDLRSNPRMADRQAFYGRGWRTDAGRAMARRLPRIGQPYPSSARPRAR